MLQLRENGTGTTVIIGNDLQSGMRPQVVVPARVWQGARLQPGGSFALLGTTMSPGFEFADYMPGVREDLLRKYPGYADQICALTRD
jgi:predicted cupin superfamily sugar epimerase